MDQRKAESDPIRCDRQHIANDVSSPRASELDVARRSLPRSACTIKNRCFKEKQRSVRTDALTDGATVGDPRVVVPVVGTIPILTPRNVAAANAMPLSVENYTPANERQCPPRVRIPIAIAVVAAPAGAIAATVTIALAIP
jgi:hypothetical protein